MLPIVAICLGSVVFIIAFLGCCGALRENNCMTMTYSFLLLALLVCQIVFVVMVWVYQSQLLVEFDNAFNLAWKQRNDDPAVMDSFQTVFKCCGNDGPLDYKNVIFPKSCCPSDKLIKDTCAITQSYNSGCKTTFHAFWSKNIEIIKFAGLGIALIEFVGVVFACCLSNSIRNERRRAHY
ncbi:CD63.2 family protein [Megaselia abdita]